MKRVYKGEWRHMQHTLRTQYRYAGMMTRPKSAVAGEERRNRGLKGKRPQLAHRLALHRRQVKMQPPICVEHWR